MQENAKGVIDIEKFIKSLPATWIKIILQPVAFFKQMPRSGGFVDPILFLLCMAVVTAVLNIILSIFGLGFSGSFWMALASIIIYPVLMAIFSFVGTVILFFIWKIMGSNESFEAAYRCGAYAYAIMPVTIILGILPYLGVILALLWAAFLMVVASVEVHNLKQQTAWTVFGIIFIVFSLINIGAQCASRKIMREVQKNSAEKVTEELKKNLDDMSPEQAEAIQKFLQKFQKQIDEKDKKTE